MYARRLFIGYIIVWHVTKVICALCSTNCLSCNAGARTCTSCPDGYYPLGSGCQPCYGYCATCSNATSCDTCKPGYYSPSSFCNSRCSINCEYGLCEDDTGYCSNCPNGRYGHRCDFDCKFCKNEQCDLRHCKDGCKVGYWQYNTEDYTECRACVANCTSCITSSACTVCNVGTYLYKSSETISYCLSCPSGCEKCSYINSCSVCKPGYFGSACQWKCSDAFPGCIATSTTSTTATTPRSIINTDYTESTDTTVPSSTPENVVPECVPQSLQPQNEDFQTSTFVVGFVTGVGAMALVGVVWFLVRRKRLSESSNTTRQSEHFYENNVRTVESGLSQDTPEPVNTNTGELSEEHDYDPVNVDRVTASDDTVNNINNEYTSLNVGQVEHIYKDLAAP